MNTRTRAAAVTANVTTTQADPFAVARPAASRPANDTRKPGAARRLRFHMMGYLFTYRPDERQARVRIDMWRENPRTGERHWITVAATAPERKSARRVALALVAWLRSCDVEDHIDPKSQAVAESFAMLRERMSVLAPEARGSVLARPVAEGQVLPSNETQPVPEATAATRSDARGGSRARAA